PPSHLRQEGATENPIASSVTIQPAARRSKPVTGAARGAWRGLSITRPPKAVAGRHGSRNKARNTPLNYSCLRLLARASVDRLKTQADSKWHFRPCFSLERAFAPAVSSSTSVAVAIDDCQQNTGSNPQGDL